MKNQLKIKTGQDYMISVIKKMKFPLSVLLLFFWMSSCTKNEDIQPKISTLDNKDEAIMQSLNVAGWSAWQPVAVGGVLTSGPTVASWAPGRLDVFARG